MQPHSALWLVPSRPHPIKIVLDAEAFAPYASLNQLLHVLQNYPNSRCRGPTGPPLLAPATEDKMHSF